MEPIAYANGSTLDDEAITYGIVFSNFMGKGVDIFEDGTDLLIEKMTEQLMGNRVLESVRVVGVHVNEVDGKCRAVLSKAQVLNMVKNLVDEEYFSSEFLTKIDEMRINNSSCQVYIRIRLGETIDDLIFTFENEPFDNRELKNFHAKSRAFHAIIASMNANWDPFDSESSQREKNALLTVALSSRGEHRRVI
jgi:hypothetical protein